MNRDAAQITTGLAVVVKRFAGAVPVLHPSHTVCGQPRRKCQGGDDRRVDGVWRGAQQMETRVCRPAAQSVYVSVGTWRRWTQGGGPDGLLKPWNCPPHTCLLAVCRKPG